MIAKSRKEAKLLGLKQYYTVPCKNGHDSPRRTTSGECIQCRAVALLKWRQANPQKVSEHNKTQYKQYELNKEAWHNRNKKYTKANPDKVLSRVRQYQLAKRKCIPKWVGKEELFLIREVYALAALRTNMFGFSWHVDHIVPIRGKYVSGLHSIENLQVIPAVDNIKKSNIYPVM